MLYFFGLEGKMERDTFDKWEIAELFGFGIKVVERDLTEMRKHDEFSNYVYNPSKKRVCIELVGYKKFLRYKDSLRKKKL
ncbi:DNA-binding protein [Lactococcus lactis subsp. hordniae]|uniref:DNA-binding protein n=2 Tax=Lactococcus lactis TaxID=1358 RepID=A0A2A5SEV5_LACLH|nr:DNA-binding protein [Lactococcus lactis subsp. hordniae]MCT3134879.1 DNA-binding protein [Lactococcus lactis]PCS12014.1 excisionase [Lactococcus lactis subsp. hordniae]